MRPIALLRVRVQAVCWRVNSPTKCRRVAHPFARLAPERRDFVTNEDARFCFASRAPEQTAHAAELLAGAVSSPIVISLIGALVVGKTHFVKGLAHGLGLCADEITSPTFAIVNEYGRASGLALVHMDFYRLESEMALEEVGFLDLLSMDAVLAIEWADRFPEALPADRLEIEIERRVVAPLETEGPDAAQHEQTLRRLRARAWGPSSEALLQDWRKALGIEMTTGVVEDK
ncbi:MAG: tRNA (adenosine(37)-N6)-threonylcarbamoyltransferase complex ATPase subunit type 1 TsaE [bacterium]|nr:tRNA (adenosine(37)-N6)-threonylcarbamoyltransferase complex ATPase subunit type 1 TsaE [bacterium]